MTLNFTQPNKVIIDMKEYIKNDMLDHFPKEKLNKNPKTPHNENLFKVSEHSPKLNNRLREQFHTMVAKGLFACKRARHELQPVIAFLCTRVQEPTNEDWAKLERMMQYLSNTADLCLTLEVGDELKLQWYVDAAFAVHKDYKSHTGATMTMGKGSVISLSTKQKINTRSSTEAELVAVDDALSLMMWSKHFLEKQGQDVKTTILYQDNKSTILLEKNGRASAGKRSRHLNIRYFYVTYLIDRDELQVEYCPTESMVADYFTKPVMGADFKRFRTLIQNDN